MAYGRRVLAGMPAEYREREEVRERYRGLYEETGWIDSVRVIATSGWTIFFVAFFAVLAALEFGAAVIAVTGLLLALIWASGTREQHIESEHRFVVGVAGRPPRKNPSATFIYWSLAVVGILGWISACAFVGVVVVELVERL